MNPTKLSAVAACALIALAGTLSSLHAAIDISDSATYYAPENWYAIRNGGAPTISPLEDAYGITIGNFKYDSMFFCYFNPVVLDGGQHLTISGTLTLSSVYTGTATTNTVIGIFDSKAYSQSALNETLLENSLKNAYDSKNTTLSASAITGGMAGFATSTVRAYNRNNPSTNATCLTTTSGGKEIETYVAEFSEPTAQMDYAFEISVIREESGTYACSFSLGGEESRTYTTLENSVMDNLNVFAVKTIVGTGGSVTLTNLSIATTGTVVPEPSTFGLMGGGLFFALAVCSRRRRTKCRRVPAASRISASAKPPPFV